DPLRELQIGRIELDVEGDEERSCPDDDRAGGGVHALRSRVGDMRGVEKSGESLVLGLADIGKPDALKARRRLRVEVHRYLVALRDLAPETVRELDALVHRHSGQRNE